MDTSTPNPLLTTPALELVAAELRRVQLQLGYSAARDDQYTKDELTDAALAYLVAPQVREQLRIAFEPGAPSAETVAKVCHWPWPVDTFKPATDDSVEGRIRELVKGVGLAVSEISRLQRASGHTVSHHVVVTCAFCGQSYGPGTPTSGALVLGDHVRVCPQHPMRRVEALVVKLLTAVTELLDAGSIEKLRSLKRGSIEKLRSPFDPKEAAAQSIALADAAITAFELGYVPLGHPAPANAPIREGTPP